ncbi:MAG: PhzF family phenazine biosynthesis protein, partial [Erysipelotrichaceae bacterium]|nr:PhzF family phenazine biosynthesis protein [Erysipelotrichaceae bacterium]
MIIKQYVIDAFTKHVFKGNPAAVCIMDEWLSDETMQLMAIENNLSETAFVVKRKKGHYGLRWFTPGGEIDLCGHATLASAYAVHRFDDPEVDVITFHTLSGELYIKTGELLRMDFPLSHYHQVEVTDLMEEVCGVRPQEAYLARDLLMIFDDENQIINMKPDLTKMMHLDGICIGVSAPGSHYDCVSRVFVPKLKINEDPVTGSIHCMITPYWLK